VRTQSAADPKLDATAPARFALLVAACALALGFAAAPAAADPEFFERRDAEVYLVPVGACTKPYLVALAEYYEGEFGIRMGITPALPYRDGIYQADRKQLATEPTLAWLMAKFDEYSTRDDSVFIGVTHNDIYVAMANVPWSFTQRVPPQFALVSSYRTTAAPPSDLKGIREVKPGLRKLVTQAIGELRFQRPTSSNPRDVMYGPLVDLADLEGIDEATARSTLLE
jgi:hypothetical protein